MTAVLFRPDPLARAVPPRGRSRGILAGLVLASAVGSCFGAAEPPRDVASFRAAVGAAKPSLQGWPLAHVQVDLGYGRLDVAQGTLVAVEQSASAPMEFVVVGDARFRLTTADPVESYQLQLFTGSTSLDEAVSAVVFIVGEPDLVKTLTARPGLAPLEPTTAKSVAEAFSSWRASPAWRRVRGPSILLEASEGDPRARGRFVAWCRSERLGTILYTLDPFAAEQVALTHYVDPRFGDQEAESIKHQLRAERDEGRQLTTRLEDFGDWDTWFSASLPAAEGSGGPGHEAFESRHYELALRVADDLERVEGHARVDLLALTAGEEVVHVRLHPDLVVGSVTDGAGRPLRFDREGSLVTVLLAEAPAQGAQTTIDVAYGGVLFTKDDNGIRYKRDTYSWYPHVGTVDRATYHAVLDVPGGIDVLASGTKDAETVEGGRRRQTRTLPIPSAEFGFEIGHYAIESHQLGHVKLEIGFLKDVPLSMGADRGSVVGTIGDALATYEDSFGPYPLDTLTVATTWQPFAQGFLGFVTLAQPVVNDASSKDVAAVDKRRVIAHELAHQWWGNMVGWASYRDQWLSEALANYSASLWSRRATDADPARRVANAFLEMQPKSVALPEMTSVDRPVEAIGPVTLGSRLDSSVADAYETVVYEKGAMVFGMLGAVLGEQPFTQMLKEIAQRVHNRAIDTPTFIEALSKMSGRDLGAFEREFVNGVGYPEVHYTYAVSPAEGGAFEVRGTVQQVPRGFRRDRLAALGEGRFDLAPVYVPFAPVEGAELDVPAILTVAEEKEAAADQRLDRRLVRMNATRWTGFTTTVHAKGESTPFVLRVPQRPEQVRLDPRRTLPVPVWNETLEAKRGEEQRASALRSAGRGKEAEAAFREALGKRLEIAPEEAGEVRGNDVPWWNQRLDGRIHVALAEMALDDGRPDDAAAELGAKEVRIAADAEREVEIRRRIVRARLALRSGEAKQAYDLLAGVLALDIRQRESDTAADEMREAKFREGWWGDGGDYLLLAVAALRSDHATIAHEAAAEAVRRGADATGLEAMGLRP